MTWVYVQRTGELYRNGLPVSLGYSGRGTGRNNPEQEAISDVGPIPRGEWRIVGPPETTAEHGPYVLRLEPEPDTDTFGRTGFLIHGDRIAHPGTASLGCIVLPRETRELVWESEDEELTVVAEPSDAQPKELSS